MFGSILNGVFEGKIILGDGSEYYVEPSWKYANGNEEDIDIGGHSVIYADDDVEFQPHLEKNGGCGLDSLLEGMRKDSRRNQHHASHMNVGDNMFGYNSYNSSCVLFTNVARIASKSKWNKFIKKYEVCMINKVL